MTEPKELCPSCNHDIDDHYTSVKGTVRCCNLHTEGGETTGVRMPYFDSKRCDCRDYIVICADWNCQKPILQGEPRAFGRGNRIYHEACGKRLKAVGY